MEKIGPFLVLVILATCSDGVFGFGNRVHKYDDYVHPGRTTTSKYGNVFYPKGTTTYKFDHDVYPEGTQTFKYDNAVISEPVKDGHTEKKTRQRASNAYENGLYTKQTPAFNSDHVVSSGQTAPNAYDDGIYSERTISPFSDHVVSSGQKASNSYDNGSYPERTTTSNFDHLVSSEQITAHAYDDGIHSERTIIPFSDHVVSSGQKASNAYEYGLYPEQTSTFNSDHMVSSGQTAANAYEYGLNPEQTSTFNTDHVVSSRQTAANTYDNGLYPERTTPSFSYHVVHTGQSAANTYNDGLYPERTKTSNSDHLVSSEQIAANTYNDGLHPERTTTLNSDHVVSSEHIAANTFNDGLYPERTTTSNSDHVVSSEQIAANTYADGLYPVRTTPLYSDHVVSSTQIAANTYADGLYPERSTPSFSYHVVHSRQSAAKTYNDGLYPGQTITPQSDHVVSTEQTEGTAAYMFNHSLTEVVHLQDQNRRITANKLDALGKHVKRNKRFISGYGVYPVQTTKSIVDDSELQEWTTRYNYDDSVYPKRTRIAKYGYDIYTEGTTRYNHDHIVYPKGTSTAKHGYDVNLEGTTRYNFDHSVYPKGTSTAKHGDDVNLEGTTKYSYDHSVYHKATSTAKHGYDVHQGGTTIYNNGHIVYPKGTRIAKYGYDVNLEGTTRYNNDHIIYHKGTRTSKYGYGVYSDWPRKHVYDNGVTTETYISKDPEKKTRLERYCSQDVEQFQLQHLNGPVMQKLLCNPFLTYNISLVNGVIPYFSHVRIFFADDTKNCKDLLNKFIESKNNVVSNADIYNFLTNDSTCLEYAFFNDQRIFLHKYREKNSMGIGFLFPYKAHAIHIYVILKQQSCWEDLYQYVYLNGFGLSNVLFDLSIDNIIDFSKESNCLDVHFSCDRTIQLYDRWIHVPGSTIAYVQIGMAVEITIVNVFALFIFLQKENRTPVTILLSFLAVSDSATVLSMTIPFCTTHEIQLNSPEEQTVPLFYFPECLIYTFFQELTSVFHLTSVLITSLLCLQKTAALLLPMWSKRRLNNRVSIICCIIAFFSSVCINLPPLFETLLSFRNFNGRCCSTYSNDTHSYHYTIINICYFVSCLVVTLCTVYIICKLTCLRRNLPWTDSPAVQKRNRISAVTVVSICLIFLFSESAFIVHIVTYTLYVFDSSYKEIYAAIDTAVRQYTAISLMFGFSLNFIVYIVMSKQLRDKLVIGIVNIERRCKCW